MTHECHNTLSDSSLDIRLFIQHFCKVLCIALLSHQRGTHHHIQVETLHIGICKVAVTVVHEVLHIGIAYTTVLLTRNHLQRLNHNLFVACQTDSGEPVLRIKEFFWIHILASTSLVDTDGRREREEYIPSIKLLPIILNHFLEGVVSLLPSRTEGHQQNHFVAGLTCLDSLVDHRLIA